MNRGPFKILRPVVELVPVKMIHDIATIRLFAESLSNEPVRVSLVGLARRTQMHEWVSSAKALLQLPA